MKDRLPQRSRKRGDKDKDLIVPPAPSKMAILSLFGTIDFDPGYDYKRERQRERRRGSAR